MRESNIRLNTREKAVVLFAFAFIFLALFIPLWQIGENHSLEMKISYDELALAELKDEERRVRLAMATEDAESERALVLSSIVNDRDTLKVGNQK